MELQYLHNKLLRVLEKILSRSKLLTDVYVKLQEKIILEEFSQIDISDGAKVLVIGCGPIPNTVITLARAKKWDITAVDRDGKAIKNASKVIDMYNLDNVKLLKADGVDINLNGYDLIVVALGIEPKKEILKRIARCADNGTYIVCRTAGAFSSIWGKENLNLDEIGLRLVKRYMRRDGAETLFLKKEK